MSRAVGLCACLCHRSLRGTASAAHHMGKHMKALAWQRRAEMWPDLGSVEDTDVIEAAVASGCSCLPAHCPALLTGTPPRRPRIVRRAPPFDPASDTQRTQADGATDNGEGAE